ncbi:MAG: DUF3047 domain-containing protein [Thermodesulfobacteriota bacterium]
MIAKRLKMGLIAALSVMALLLPVAFLSNAGPDTVLEVGIFSGAAEGTALPSGWTPMTFSKIPRHTRYDLVKDGDLVVVKATSEASSSGLIRRIRIDPVEYPIIEWRWKVLNIYKKGDVRKKEGDDYPARIYVTFEYSPSDMGLFDKVKYETARLLYGEYPPGGAITYIWESKAPKGTIAANPYADQVRMIVVESGTTRLNQWIREERNIYEDYQAVFKKKPPLVSGVAVMTDSDNTGESAVSFYGDIIFKKTANQ